jgi:hypothetical protein
MLNEPQPDGSYLNDITTRRAKFVVGEQAWKQAYAEAAFESLFQMLTQLATASPEVVVNLLDLVFDMHPNLPKKAAIVARMRSVNGQSDPNGKLTPEQQQQQAEKAAMAKAEYDAQMAQVQATIQETVAKGLKLESAAMLDKITLLYEAAQAAQVLVQAPGAAPVADELVKSVGFVGAATGAEPVIDAEVPQRQPTQDPMMQEPQQPLPELQQADGAQAGIETPGADGAMNQGSL